MFSIFHNKKIIEEVDFSGLKTDMHSHLLPGIDDGSPDIETSIRLIKGLQNLGYTRFITTPHVLWDMYKNTPASIKAAQQIVHNALPDVKLKSAAEYFMDEYFDSLLANQETALLTIAQNTVLVEFSFVSPPIDLNEKIFDLQIKGYQPVLAHPERYQYFAQQQKKLNEFKDMGCLFQVNILSLTGYYGKPAADLAIWLVEKNMVDFLGTDLHHLRHLEALQHSGSIMKYVKSLLDTGKLQNPLLFP